jgi:hypothetical protein
LETAEDLQCREIGLKVLTKAIGTITPGGRLVFHVFAAVAEFERELMLERTYAGLAFFSNVRLHPACFNAARWCRRSWSSVDTRA